MAKSGKSVMPQKEAEEKRKTGCFSSEDLECRSQSLDLALMRRKALGKLEFKRERGMPQGKVACAIKLSSEFLASIIVGIVLGLGFDKLAGSLPWGLVFFLFLGFAAGVLNVLRSVGYTTSNQLEKKESGAWRQNKDGANKRSDK
ncbi:AtpZ/AtpI family protein [Bartonella sp. CB189]|uniref:AtpZ/AtpI family protein n=1 Tax=Bartonella sp. CB189 TaxID=3112254 RepID=UPI002F965D86